MIDVSRIADALFRRISIGSKVVLWLSEEPDLASLSQPPLSNLFTLAVTKGAEMRLALDSTMLEKLDEAARAGLRNASHRHRFTLWTGAGERAPNGAALIATLLGPSDKVAFYSRDGSAATAAASWGVGKTHPIVSWRIDAEPSIVRLPDDFFERKSRPGDRVATISSNPARPIRLFGTGLVSNLLKPNLETVGLWKPGLLASLRYIDRYIKAPLPAMLLMRVAAVLRDQLAEKGQMLPLVIETAQSRADHYRGAPYKVWDNWPNEADQESTIRAMAGLLKIDCCIERSVPSLGRKLVIRYKDESEAWIFFDQGFGYWQASGNAQHNFRAAPATQARALLDSSVAVAGRGDSYVAITKC